MKEKPRTLIFVVTYETQTTLGKVKYIKESVLLV